MLDWQSGCEAWDNTVGGPLDEASVQVTCMTLAPEQAGAINFVHNTNATLPVTRFFTKPETDPYDEIAWEIRSAVIEGQSGPVFEQHEIEFPDTWSQNATNVVASKYFRGPLKPTPNGMKRERSVKELIDRVVNAITGWGWQDGYFASEDERDTFHAELKYALVNQYLCFNSPVWFNVGVEEKPQCSA